jgi:hypothetical protein
MAADRHTRITIETERLLIIACQHSTRERCRECGREAELLPLDRARALLNRTTALLEGQQRNDVHRWLAKDGLIFVCLKTLRRFLRAGGGQRNC